MFISEIFTGRPDDVLSRSAAEQRSYEILDRLGIEYRRADHDRAATMEDLVPVEAALDCRICKNLFLTNRQQTEFTLLLMPGDKPFKTKFLSKQLGCARLSFANEEQLLSVLGVHPGSASVLAMAFEGAGNVRLVIDEELKDWEYIGCHPCENTSSLKIRTDDILNVFLPAVGCTPAAVSLPWETEEQ